MKAKFTVTLDMPEGMSKGDMKQYIEDAVKSWAGCYPPNEPVFDLNRNSVKATHQRKKKEKAYCADDDPNYSPAMFASDK